MKITIFQLFRRDSEKNATNATKKTKSKTTIYDKSTAKPAIAWRELISFWIFGLCTEFGYVVMICAAYDILSRFEDVRVPQQHIP